MFDRRKMPFQQNSFAAAAALVLMSGVLATPSLAATSGHIPCEKSTAATLLVQVDELAAELVSHSASSAKNEEMNSAANESLLAPLAEAAIRDAFSKSENMSRAATAPITVNAISTPPMAGTDAKSEIVEDSDDKVESDTVMNTRLPGISDDDLLRYKKQMYRRDI